MTKLIIFRYDFLLLVWFFDNFKCKFTEKFEKVAKKKLKKALFHKITCIIQKNLLSLHQ